ncbi:phosphopantetheine-binding protein [Asticcacaulis sp. SL142]|uniref:phosphopantetheine-binding protein n=1 Tax=Asticcacaulis sp. SL142 TaxID=2995155 RepID=UPI00226CDCFD|nr:phosphopantetheine-binding protein [Asticcacaulis sp. SL142]WAC49755.1 phosphopantetheine-binding protein [Asticcacaulis sp. SL142]
MDKISTISTIWATTLGVPSVGPDDNFFALGGDSLMVTIMAFQVEQALDVIVNADLVFDHPTLATFSKALLA